MSEPAVHHLVPTATLQAIARGMAVLARTEPTRAEQRAGVAAARGAEAVWAAALAVLEPGDLLSRPMGQLEGTRLAQVTRAMGRDTPPTEIAALGPDEETRVLGALGAAAALRAQGQQRLVLVVAAPDGLSAAGWRRILAAAGGADLPTLFVLLPAFQGPGSRRLCTESQRAGGRGARGVPGMPVDAGDAVALCRVLQESVLRARAGDGPALLEPVLWRGLAGSRPSRTTSAIQMVRAVLRARGARQGSRRGPRTAGRLRRG